LNAYITAFAGRRMISLKYGMGFAILFVCNLFGKELRRRIMFQNIYQSKIQSGRERK